MTSLGIKLIELSILLAYVPKTVVPIFYLDHRRPQDQLDRRLPITPSANTQARPATPLCQATNHHLAKPHHSFSYSYLVDPWSCITLG